MFKKFGILFFIVIAMTITFSCGGSSDDEDIIGSHSWVYIENTGINDLEIDLYKDGIWNNSLVELLQDEYVIIWNADG
jgi:hypothetical protein